MGDRPGGYEVFACNSMKNNEKQRKFNALADPHPPLETLLKSFEKQSFGSFLELWSVSGASGASLGCSRHPLLSVPEQYNLAKPTVKPIENRMRPENSQYKTQYARNENQ